MVHADMKWKFTEPQEKSRSILKLSHTGARRFLLKAGSYCTLDLPSYFEFEKLLNEINNKLSGKMLSDFFSTNHKPRNCDDVNYVIINNKNGKYTWRPIELIHPALYVSLVHKITDETHWKTIRSRFNFFAKNKKIECVSHPVKALTQQKDKAEQISHWWQEVEQRSIELALDYEYLIQTDITDCYGSIYTHSIAWALHGKDFAKNNRGDKTLIGNLIDAHIQDMCHGQTNGIPQGSVLMDFIAEMVLGYADSELTKKIMANSISDYHILRYRDDYQIFVNNPQDGEKILKLLTETLIDLGLKLDPSKTAVTNQVIKESIKPDKLFWIGQKQKEGNLQKQLLIIYNLSQQFPNSGSLVTALTDYHKRISNLTKTKGDILPLISIITDVAYHNPRTYAISSAILSRFINLIESDDEKRAVVDKIIKRFEKIPNTGHLLIWLQRITIIFNRKYEYKEPLCQLVKDVPSVKIWNSDWLQPSFSKLINPDMIINQEKIEKLTPVITKIEVELFISKDGDY